MKPWVKFESNNPTRVSIEGCEIIDDLIKACKRELYPHFDSIATDQLGLSFTENGQVFRPDTLLSSLNM